MRARPSAIAVLPTPGIADEKRVVLLPPAQDLNGALHLELAADQRIDLAVGRLLVEVDAIGLERLVLLRAALLGLAAASLAAVLALLIGAFGRTGIARAGALGDPMADVVHGVIARHILLLQEISGVAFALGEDRDEHIGAGHLLAAGGLHMDHRPLDDALEAGGRLRFLAARACKVLQLGVDIIGEIGLELLEIDIAGAHDGGRVLIVDESQQEVLERRVFVPPLIGERERAMQGLFEVARE